MKGFTKDGKFHPIKPYNKVRKSRETKEQGVKVRKSIRKKRFLSEKDFRTMSKQEINVIFKDIEKRWEGEETTGSLDGDGFSMVYTNKENSDYTFELHPLEDEEYEDENGKKLDEPIITNAWYWFPAQDGRGLLDSPNTMSATGGYTREDAIRQFKKDLILYDQEFE